MLRLREVWTWGGIDCELKRGETFTPGHEGQAIIKVALNKVSAVVSRQSRRRCLLKTFTRTWHTTSVFWHRRDCVHVWSGIQLGD